MLKRPPFSHLGFSLVGALLLVPFFAMGQGCKAPAQPAPKSAPSSAKESAANTASGAKKTPGKKTVADILKTRKGTLKRMPRADQSGDVTKPIPAAAGGTAATASTSATPTPTTKPTAVAYDAEMVQFRAIQVALMAKELAPYWHADKSGRKPVRVAKSGPLASAALGPHPQLKLLGEPVVIVAPDDKVAPHVNIESVSVQKLPSNELLATVALSIPVEGVRAKGLVVGEGMRWRVQQMNVSEQ